MPEKGILTNLKGFSELQTLGGCQEDASIDL